MRMKPQGLRSQLCTNHNFIPHMAMQQTRGWGTIGDIIPRCGRAGQHLLAMQLVRDLHADLQAREVPVAALHVGHRQPPVVGLTDLPAGAQSATLRGWPRLQGLPLQLYDSSGLQSCDLQ